MGYQTAASTAGWLCQRLAEVPVATRSSGCGLYTHAASALDDLNRDSHRSSPVPGWTAAPQYFEEGSGNFHFRSPLRASKTQGSAGR